MKKQAKKTEIKSEKVAIRPLGDKVVIRELDEKETGRKTESGIYIPDSVKEDRESRQGKVVAVGAGRMEDGKRIAPEVKVGDTVLFSWGDKVKHEGQEYFVVSESSVIAVIK